MCNQTRYIRKKDELCKSCSNRGIAPNDLKRNCDRSTPSYEDTKIRDNEKTRICYENNWVLFRTNNYKILSSPIKFQAALRGYDEELEADIPRESQKELVLAAAPLGFN
jgi:hypothetical protein